LDRQERTAYHEAGHAVMAYLEQIAISHASIIENEESFGRVVLKSVVGPSFEFDLSWRNRKSIEKHCKVYLAGSIAERLARGRANWRGAHGDRSALANLIQYVYAQEEVVKAYVDYLSALTASELKNERTWRAVTAVAKELLERGRLGGRTVRRIVREALRPPGMQAEVARLLASVRPPPGEAQT
jgi:hypothetical protein